MWRSYYGRMLFHIRVEGASKDRPAVFGMLTSLPPNLSSPENMLNVKTPVCVKNILQGRNLVNLLHISMSEIWELHSKQFCCHCKLLCRVGAFQLWNQMQLSARKQSCKEAINMSTIAVASSRCGRDTQKGKGRNREPSGISLDMMTVCKEGRLKEAVQLLDLMDQRGIQAYTDLYTCLLQGCVKKKSLTIGKQVHAHIIKSGFELDVFLGNNLVSMYTKCGSVVDARQIFDKMPIRNVVSWTAIISGYVQQGHDTEALELFREMQQEGVKPDKFTFSTILNACTSPAALGQGRHVHVLLIQSGFELDIHVGTALVNMYAKCGSLVDARQVFDKMPIRNVVSWTAIISGLAQQEHGEEAFELFWQMLREGLKPDKVTFVSILNACAGAAGLEQGKRIHSHIIEVAIESDMRLENALVSMYTRCGSVVDAQQVFKKMWRRDVVSWTLMIAGYVQLGHTKEAFDLFRQMQQEGVKPDTVALKSILNACASPAALRQGKYIHAHIINNGIKSDIRLENALISMYFRCGEVVDARQLFDKMSERDVVSWTVMIAGYAQHAHGKEAFDLFWEMLREGMKPDKVVFVAILNACASLGTLEQGKRIHTHIIKAECPSDVIVGNALIDMYGKCGSLEDAHYVFNEMLERDVISWTAMILGYAQHGRGKEALQFFQQMQQEGMKPDTVTFIGVLSSCSNAGLVDEGQYYFHSMSRDHGVTPTVGHYGCMVDLLGRAGRLDDAEDLIKKMPFEPDASLWGALLGACRVYGNVELAERAAKFTLRLEPQNAGVYVLLSNIYAAAGRWDNVVKVRKVMEERGLKKDAGRSWIEVNNKVHSFVGEDRSHPQTQEIYAELERLTEQMKEAGYVPDTRFVLHDVDQQQKELALYHHSERLAIVFGLISMPPGTPVRITKTFAYVVIATLPLNSFPRLLGEKLLPEMPTAFITSRMGPALVGIIGDDRWKAIK